MKQITASFPMTASADLESRTITGLAVPYGVEGYTSWGRTIVQAGAIEVGDRVHMLVSHDSDRPIGKMIDSQDGDTGLMARFKIAATGAGDDALLEASEGIRDGLSVGLGVDEYAYDMETDITTIIRASLREVSLVTFPAFDQARVEKVAASEPDPDTQQTPEAAPAVEDNHQEEPVDESTAVVEAAAPASLPRARVQDPFPYRAGVQASFFADMLNAKHDADAAARTGVAQSMMTAAQVSSDIASIIPEGYRPDLYVGELGVSTPLINAFQQFSLADARPFRVPVFVSATGMIDDHVEGTNPTDGTLALDDLLVSPSAVSGQYTISREAVLGATPGVDAIIMNAIRQAVASKRESDFAAVLLATGNTGIAITATAQANVLANILDYQDGRLNDPSAAFAGSDLFLALASEVDGMDRPMSPFNGASNANGTLGSGARTLNVAGYDVGKAWAITGGLLGIYTDAASWWSGLTEWRWEEVDGPANIRFAAFGIQAGAILREAGVMKFAMAGA